MWGVVHGLGTGGGHTRREKLFCGLRCSKSEQWEDGEKIFTFCQEMDTDFVLLPASLGWRRNWVMRKEKSTRLNPLEMKEKR